MRRRAGAGRSVLVLVVLALVAGCAGTGGVRAVRTRPAGSTAALPLDSEATVATLANGLTTIVRDNDRPGGEVQLRLVVDAGSMLQEPDQVGVAHFLEHMMFNGTAEYPKNDLTAALQHFGASFGADVNASTTYDETVYELTVPSDPEAVDTAVDILHEWLTAATLGADDVTAERGVVLDEWRQRSETDDGRTFAAFEDALFAGSSYADRSPIGTDAAIQAMTPELLRRFYDRWYRPDNATIVVVGDIDASRTTQQLADTFAGATPRTGDPLDRPVPAWQPADAPVVVVHRDPDLTSAVVEVVLAEPDEHAAARAPATRDDVRRQTFDDLIATILSNRLDDARRRGSSAVTAVGADTLSPVRAVSLTGVFLTAAVGQSTAALQSLLDEIQQASSAGFDAGEVDRAVAAARAANDDARSAAATINDGELAHALVQHVLTGAPASDPDVVADAGDAALDEATPAALSAELARRWSTEHPYVLVAAPDAAEGVPSVEDVERMVAASASTSAPPTTAPQATDEQPDALMARPAPVEEASTSRLDGDGDLIDPTVLHFANGLDVVLARNTIADGEVTVAATRAGGLSVYPDEQVVAARMAPWIVAASGLGDLDAVQVGHVVSATGIDLSPGMWEESAAIQGTTPTDDLETAMAYLHLLLADGHVDDAALASQIDAAREATAGATTDPDMAGYLALDIARFGDDPRYRSVLTDDELDSVGATDVLAAWRAGFGDASGWRIALVGDFDVDAATALARSYLGTLEAGTAPGHFVDRLPAFPPGATRQEVRAGTGDRASLIRLAEADVDDVARAEVLADLLTGVLDTRLTATVREELGASYSPSASVYVLPTPRPTVVAEIDVTGAPDDMARLHDVIDEQLADLVADGPTDQESDDAIAAEDHELQYVDNVTIAMTLADMATRPDGLADYISNLETLDGLHRADIAALAAELFGGGRYVEITTLPA